MIRTTGAGNLRAMARMTMRMICLALTLVSLLAGCVPPASVVYVPDPNAPIAGWKCPNDRQFIAHTNPPCTWIPGGVLTDSCHEEYVRHINEARGCIPETASVRNAGH